MGLTEEVQALRREVLVTQRERTDKAFDDMKLSLLEQELASKAHRERMEKAFTEVRLSMLEQELAQKVQLQTVLDVVEKLANQADEQEAWRVQIEARVGRLEQGRPPAA